jgi:aspartate aminotransferase-like enzyme
MSTQDGSLDWLFFGGHGMKLPEKEARQTAFCLDLSAVDSTAGDYGKYPATSAMEQSIGLDVGAD